MCKSDSIYEQRISFLSSLGYTPVSTDLSSKLEVQCRNGHIFKRNWADFQKGVTVCVYCENEKKIEFLKSLGYEVISDNLNKNLEVKCSQGHIFKRTYKSFKEGATSCPLCEYNSKIRLLNELGYEVVSKNGYNIGNDLEVRCSNGHTFKRSFTHFKDGITFCPNCKKQDKVDLLNNFGYTLISIESSDSLKVKCQNGHIFKRSYTNFKKGSILCPECEIQKKKDTINHFGYKITSAVIDEQITIECPNNHIITKRYSNFLKGQINCPLCKDEKKIEFLRSLEYEVVSDNLASELEVKCSKGHTFKRNYGHFKEGKVKCPICYPTRSQFELDVEEHLPSPQINVFGVIPNYELDFYLPEHNLAIECNGDYWHSIEFKDKDYHLEKYNLCKEKGIRLIQIPESEWYSKKEWFVSLIKCYLENGNFSQFLEGNKFNLMYLSESLFENYNIENPSLSGKENYKYWNCGYGILSPSKRG